MCPTMPFAAKYLCASRWSGISRGKKGPIVNQSTRGRVEKGRRRREGGREGLVDLCNHQTPSLALTPLVLHSSGGEMYTHK